MPPTTRLIKTSLDHGTDTDASTSKFPPSEQRSVPALVACFLLPPEQLENLVSMLKGLAANPASAEALPSSSYETTTSTSNAAWLTHFEAARYLGISTSTLYRYVERERIECRKTGNRLEYRLPALDQFKEDQIRPARRPTCSGYNPSTLNSGK
jgi:excisionase family DNA binding protein